MPATDFVIAPAATAADLAAIRDLFLMYQRSLAIDLCFQGFAEEVATLPGKYAPPAGVLILARRTDATAAPVGCVALRPLCGDLCEIKRLFTVPAARGLGLGRALVARLLAEAAARGYAEVRLDTLPDMTEAIALYRGLGFVETGPYYPTPVAGTVFFAHTLVPYSANGGPAR